MTKNTPLSRKHIVRRCQGGILALLTLCLAASASAQNAAPGKTPPAANEKAAQTAPEVRTVSVVRPKSETRPEPIEAQGHVMPWQETRVGTEIGGLRLVSVEANVGDSVRKGQVLARLNPASVEAELEAANAQRMEAQAALAQAEATLARARRLAPSGGVSQQELMLYQTQKETAAARLKATQAQVRTQQLRLDSATLIAPDAGIISSRSAAEGAIVQAGSELFRLIRQGRLEWRAEVDGETLLKIAAGQEATVRSPLGSEVRGRVRQVSPTVDLNTRRGLIYVDLPEDGHFKAGLRVSGTLTLQKKILVLPLSAIVADGNRSRIVTVNAENRIESVEVRTGETLGGLTEITSPLDRQLRVVAENGDALKPGETVRVRQNQEKTANDTAGREKS